jgi:hypothetical protein
MICTGHALVERRAQRFVDCPHAVELPRELQPRHLKLPPACARVALTQLDREPATRLLDQPGRTQARRDLTRDRKQSERPHVRAPWFVVMPGSSPFTTSLSMVEPCVSSVTEPMWLCGS